MLRHCTVALAAVGWAPRVRRFPDRDDTDHLALIELIEAPPNPADVELAAAIGQRRADRRPYRAETLPAGSLEMLHIRTERDGLRFGVVPRVRWGRSGDDIMLQYGRTADAPADGGVLLVIGADTDDAAAQVRAGEVLSELTLAATAMGLASCPLTTPLGDARDRLSLACEVFDGEAVPQALIRVGWAPDDGDPPAVLERRSVQDTTVWML